MSMIKLGGYTVWVLNAFGPFWGFQTGYWAWVSGVIDNAIYPALAVSTFTDAYGSFGTPLTEYLVKAALAVALALPNLLGIRIVGGGMAAMSVFVMVPFVILAIWGMVRANDWEALGEVRRADIVYDDDGNFVSMSGKVDVSGIERRTQPLSCPMTLTNACMHLTDRLVDADQHTVLELQRRSGHVGLRR